MVAAGERFPLEQLTQTVEQVLPEAQVLVLRDMDRALTCAGEEAFDAALLDMDLCGPAGGVLAKKLRERGRTTQLFFLSGGGEEGASPGMEGWVLKPVDDRSIRRELEGLKNRLHPDRVLLYVQCFGNFDVFKTDRTRLRFKRKKSKELFAYLIYRRGAACGNAELACVLFEDDEYDLKRQQYLQKIIASLMETLAQVGAEEVLIRSYGSISVDVNRVQCDFYRFTHSDQEVLRAWSGEFMMQYSWAEPVAGYIEEEIRNAE